MDIQPRDSIALQQNKQGVVDSYVTSNNLAHKAAECIAWGDEPRKGLQHFWENESENPQRQELANAKLGDGSNRIIRILDSFFSDTLTDSDIRAQIFKRAVEGVPVEFLLADPQGSFGVSRASAIGQHTDRSGDGLFELAMAGFDTRAKLQRRPKITEAEIRKYKGKEGAWIDAAKALLAVIEDLPIQIRLYDKAPSGPYYFFGDMLLAGRFWTSETAAFHPWSQIVDTPYDNDLYDILLTEYRSLWETASPLENVVSGEGGAVRDIGGRNVFISYSETDENFAHELEEALKERGLEAYAYKTNVKPGDRWPDELKARLRSCDTLVAIISSRVIEEKEWIRAEIGAAWVLGKRIFQAKLGVEETLLPGILDHIWSEKIGARKDNQRLIDAIVGAENGENHE
ncbi:MAG: toll/interleukin-1 receptor domain-containing protein [Pseudomonadota bacterium]